MSEKSKDVINLKAKMLHSFRASGNGLLSPCGELYDVRLFGHFAEIAKRPEFADMIEDFTERIDDAEQNFCDNIPDGEHPEWHQFEIWKDGQESDLRTAILDKAYKLGWGRIAFVYKRPKPHLVELETHPNTVKTLKPYAQSVAEMLDAELTVHEVDGGFKGC